MGRVTKQPARGAGGGDPSSRVLALKSEMDLDAIGTLAKRVRDENVEVLVAVDEAGEIVEVLDVAVGAPNMDDDPEPDEVDLVIGLLDDATESVTPASKRVSNRSATRGQTGRSRTTRGDTERSGSRTSKPNGSGGSDYFGGSAEDPVHTYLK